jgi:hypothetical protein
MRTLKVKAVLVTDGTHFLIHGSDVESPSEMFKAMAPIWSFDPSKESAHYFEWEINIRELENPEDFPDFLKSEDMPHISSDDDETSDIG